MVRRRASTCFAFMLPKIAKVRSGQTGQLTCSHEPRGTLHAESPCSQQGSLVFAFSGRAAAWFPILNPNPETRFIFFSRARAPIIRRSAEEPCTSPKLRCPRLVLRPSLEPLSPCQRSPPNRSQQPTDQFDQHTRCIPSATTILCERVGARRPLVQPNAQASRRKRQTKNQRQDVSSP